jgi:hypothetical protein
MDLGEIGWGGVDWIGLSQDRDKERFIVNALMNFRMHVRIATVRIQVKMSLSNALVIKSTQQQFLPTLRKTYLY